MRTRSGNDAAVGAFLRPADYTASGRGVRSDTLAGGIQPGSGSDGQAKFTSPRKCVAIKRAVRLSGAKIDGDVEVTGASIDGTLDAHALVKIPTEVELHRIARSLSKILRRAAKPSFGLRFAATSVAASN